jgi:FkbM family methyltransferase
MINTILGFLSGSVIAILAVFIYWKFFKRKKDDTPYLFHLDSYNSQQFSKLIGYRILDVLKKDGLTSINESVLPLQFQSQWCEDILLYEYFKSKKNGFFIEIGAFDGVKLSNTYFFECIGWTGLLVEPQPVQFAKCKKNRPNSLCINAGVGMGTNDLELNVVETEHYETWSFVGEIDSNIKKQDFEIKTIKVPSVKIANIIPNDVKKIDFISIDVEGMEMEILQTIDLLNNGPEIILLENNKSDIQKYLSGFGYHLVYRTWINYFYSRNKDAFKDISIWDKTDIKISG